VNNKPQGGGMDIYAYAMQMEKDGELYYREIAGQTQNVGVRNILNMLAEAEVRHYQIFNRMREHETLPVADLSYLSEVKNVFAELRDRKRSLANGSQKELYQKAQKLEEQTRNFYREKSAEVEPSQKEVLLKIANEEQRHYDILENLIVMLQRPETWLENAEWYRLEEY
jgi:rubrerythrin